MGKYFAVATIFSEYDVHFLTCKAFFLVYSICAIWTLISWRVSRFEFFLRYSLAHRSMRFNFAFQNLNAFHNGITPWDRSRGHKELHFSLFEIPRIANALSLFWLVETSMFFHEATRVLGITCRVSAAIHNCLRFVLGHALLEKGLQRQMGDGTLVRSQERRTSVVPWTNQLPTGHQSRVVFRHRFT